MIEGMDSGIRILTTLNHEEPDRVPLFDLGIDSMPILEKYGGASLSSVAGFIKLVRILIPIGWRRVLKWGARRSLIYKAVAKNQATFMKTIGYDATICPVTLFLTKSEFPSKNEYVDEHGRHFFYSKIESGGKQIDNAQYKGGYFDTEDPEASYEKWGLLDPDLPARSDAYKTALKAANNEILVIPAMIGPLEGTWEGFGFTTFTKLLYQKPQFMERVFKDHGDFITALTENMLDLGAEVILILDDAGYKGAPFLSPKMYQKYIASQMKRVADKVHACDGKVMLHSCGDVGKLLDAIIGAGIDALHPWESTAGMNIFEAKEKWGEKLTLVGNVPVDMLAHGTPQDVETYVKKLMQICAPGGGYILSSGHSISYSVKLENFETMIEATRKYGSYPIRIENK